MGRDDDDEVPEPPPLRRLRLLVSLLTAVLILGVVVVSATLVIRLTQPAPAVPATAKITAPSLTLPEGHAVAGLGQGAGTVVVITRAPGGAETLRVFDAATGAPVSATPVRRAPASGGGDDAPGG